MWLLRSEYALWKRTIGRPYHTKEGWIIGRDRWSYNWSRRVFVAQAGRMRFSDAPEGEVGDDG